MKVCVTRRIPGPAVSLLKEKGFDVSVSFRDHPLTRIELLDFVKSASAMLCLLNDKIDGEVFDAAGENLKIVANYAVGFDNVDLVEAKRRGVVVTNTPSPVITQAVAEHTVALILALAKKLTEGEAFIRRNLYHGWDPELCLGIQVKGKTLGIVGLGRIGMVVAQIAGVGLGMKILYTGPNRKAEFEEEFQAEFKSLTELLKESDFVTLHVPLTDETHHLIDSEKLGLMKKTAYLINTARGSVVDERELIEALKEKVIAGAALDVFENETSVSPELCGLSNTILTPHMASATIEAREAMSRMAASNIIAVLEGRPALNPAFISD